MDTEARLKAEDEIAANFLFGSTEDEFLQKLPEACTWMRHLPHHREVAHACAQAFDTEALAAQLAAWRRAAEAYADGAKALDALPVPGPGLDPVGFTVDFDAGAMYIYLAEPPQTVARTVEITSWMLVDYDESGVPVGVELLRLDLEQALAEE